MIDLGYAFNIIRCGPAPQKLYNNYNPTFSLSNRDQQLFSTVLDCPEQLLQIRTYPNINSGCLLFKISQHMYPDKGSAGLQDSQGLHFFSYNSHQCSVSESKSVSGDFDKSYMLKSNYKSLYEEYFKDVEDEVDQAIKILETLDEWDKGVYWIRTHIGTHFYRNPFVNIVKIQRGGSVAEIEVYLGNFKVNLRVLLTELQSQKCIERVGRGSFGETHLISMPTPVIAKRIYFERKFKTKVRKYICFSQQLELAILEYSYYKIAAALNIGPKVGTDLGFDMVVFMDSIEFYMEECNPDFLSVPGFTVQQLQRRLKFCVRLLHRCKIVHKDIKPANILYSDSMKSFVLTDFGVSHVLVERPGSKTRTFCEGTPNFMSDQMHRLNANQEGLVDLYYNDLHALKVTNEGIAIQKHIQKQNIPDRLTRNNKKEFSSQCYMLIRMISLVLNRQLPQKSELAIQLDEGEDSNVLKYFPELARPDLNSTSLTEVPICPRYILILFGDNEKMRQHLSPLQQAPVEQFLGCIPLRKDVHKFQNLLRLGRINRIKFKAKALYCKSCTPDQKKQALKLLQGAFHYGHKLEKEPNQYELQEFLGIFQRELGLNDQSFLYKRMIMKLRLGRVVTKEELIELEVCVQRTEDLRTVSQLLQNEEYNTIMLDKLLKMDLSELNIRLLEAFLNFVEKCPKHFDRICSFLENKLNSLISLPHKISVYFSAVLSVLLFRHKRNLKLAVDCLEYYFQNIEPGMQILAYERILAMCYIHLHNTKMAERVLTRAFKQCNVEFECPPCLFVKSELYIMMGAVCALNNQFERALQYAEKGLLIKVADSVRYYRDYQGLKIKVQVFKRQNRLEEALQLITDFESSQKTNYVCSSPCEYQISDLKVDILTTMGRYETVIKMVSFYQTQGFTHFYFTSSLLNFKADAYEKLGRLEEAKETMLRSNEVYLNQIVGNDKMYYFDMVTMRIFTIGKLTLWGYSKHIPVSQIENWQRILSNQFELDTMLSYYVSLVLISFNLKLYELCKQISRNSFKRILQISRSDLYHTLPSILHMFLLSLLESVSFEQASSTFNQYLMQICHQFSQSVSKIASVILALIGQSCLRPQQLEAVVQGFLQSMAKNELCLYESIVGSMLQKTKLIQQPHFRKLFPAVSQTTDSFYQQKFVSALKDLVEAKEYKRAIKVINSVLPQQSKPDRLKTLHLLRLQCLWNVRNSRFLRYAMNIFKNKQFGLSFQQKIGVNVKLQQFYARYQLHRKYARCLKRITQLQDSSKEVSELKIDIKQQSSGSQNLKDHLFVISRMKRSHLLKPQQTSLCDLISTLVVSTNHK